MCIGGAGEEEEEESSPGASTRVGKYSTTELYPGLLFTLQLHTEPLSHTSRP